MMTIIVVCRHTKTTYSRIREMQVITQSSKNEALPSLLDSQFCNPEGHWHLASKGIVAIAWWGEALFSKRRPSPSRTYLIYSTNLTRHVSINSTLSNGYSIKHKTSECKSKTKCTIDCWEDEHLCWEERQWTSKYLLGNDKRAISKAKGWEGTLVDDWIEENLGHP